MGVSTICRTYGTAGVCCAPCAARREAMHLRTLKRVARGRRRDSCQERPCAARRTSRSAAGSTVRSGLLPTHCGLDRHVALCRPLCPCLGSSMSCTPVLHSICRAVGSLLAAHHGAKPPSPIASSPGLGVVDFFCTAHWTRIKPASNVLSHKRGPPLLRYSPGWHGTLPPGPSTYHPCHIRVHPESPCGMAVPTSATCWQCVAW